MIKWQVELGPNFWERGSKFSEAFSMEKLVGYNKRSPVLHFRLA